MTSARASAGGMAARFRRATASSEASRILRPFSCLGSRRSQLLDLGRAEGVVVGLAVLVVGGFGSFGLGVEADKFGCKVGSSRQLRAGEELDGDLVGQVRGRSCRPRSPRLW